MLLSYRLILPFIATSIITTLLVLSFSGYFFFEVSKDLEKRLHAHIEEYGEVDLHHLCNIVACNGIFYGKKHYDVDPQTKILEFTYTEDVKIPELLYERGNVSLREDISFFVPILPEGEKTPAYFVVDVSKFIPTLFILYIGLLIILNFTTGIIVSVVLTREKILHDIESSKDKATLQFDNLMFYIENLNHEVNSPLFVLSRKIKEIQNKFKDDNKECKNFEIISNSIEQINAVMQRTREVKKINRSSDDRTIYDLIESTVSTIRVMRSEHVDLEIDKQLDDYFLNQELLTNGTFINILTNHVKNSIEAYANILETEFISINKNKLTFSFADNGNGIPKKLRKKVFERGFSTKGNKLERGSGLAINKDIIESVGGSITINDVSEGTQFEISIQVKEKGLKI